MNWREEAKREAKETFKIEPEDENYDIEKIKAYYYSFILIFQIGLILNRNKKITNFKYIIEDYEGKFQQIEEYHKDIVESYVVLKKIVKHEFDNLSWDELNLLVEKEIPVFYSGQIDSDFWLIWLKQYNQTTDKQYIFSLNSEEFKNFENIREGDCNFDKAIEEKIYKQIQQEFKEGIFFSNTDIKTEQEVIKEYCKEIKKRKPNININNYNNDTILENIKEIIQEDLNKIYNNNCDYDDECALDLKNQCLKHGIIFPIQKIDKLVKFQFNNIFNTFKEIFIQAKNDGIRFMIFIMFQEHFISQPFNLWTYHADQQNICQQNNTGDKKKINIIIIIITAMLLSLALIILIWQKLKKQKQK